MLVNRKHKFWKERLVNGFDRRDLALDGMAPARIRLIKYTGYISNNEKTCALSLKFEGDMQPMFIVVSGMIIGP